MSVVSVTGFYTEDEPRNKSIFFSKKKDASTYKMAFLIYGEKSYHVC